MTGRSEVHYMSKLFLECNIWRKGTAKIPPLLIMGRFLLYGGAMSMWEAMRVTLLDNMVQHISLRKETRFKSNTNSILVHNINVSTYIPSIYR